MQFAMFQNLLMLKPGKIPGSLIKQIQLSLFHQHHDSRCSDRFGLTVQAENGIPPDFLLFCAVGIPCLETEQFFSVLKHKTADARYFSGIDSLLHDGLHLFADFHILLTPLSVVSVTGTEDSSSFQNYYSQPEFLNQFCEMLSFLLPCPKEAFHACSFPEFSMIQIDNISRIHYASCIL